MPYFNGNCTTNTLEYEIMIKTLSCEVIKQLNLSNEIVICGDFNTDFATTLLTKMINETNLIPSDYY